MMRFPSLIVACGLLGTAAVEKGGTTFSSVNILPRTNESLDADLGRGATGNNLSALPRGDQTFAGVRFRIEDRFILLGSRLSKETRADKVEGIEVGKTFNRLHVLQGTFYGKGKEGDPLFVPDDTQIGRYQVHYEDGGREEIPILYGQDVRDWWITRNPPGVTRGKVAWEGDNAPAKARGHRLRLYLGTWKNPRPGVKVTRIDFEKVGTHPTAPFCVGLTVESD